MAKGRAPHGSGGELLTAWGRVEKWGGWQQETALRGKHRGPALHPDTKRGKINQAGLRNLLGMTDEHFS